MTNISAAPYTRLSHLFSLIGQPARLQILVALAGQDACVCHLEAVLGLRQAAISQHLTFLRKAGLVSTRRDGRHIFYHLARPLVLENCLQTAAAAGIARQELEFPASPVPGCPCPMCNPGLDPALICKPVSKPRWKPER